MSIRDQLATALHSWLTDPAQGNGLLERLVPVVESLTSAAYAEGLREGANIADVNVAQKLFDGGYAAGECAREQEWRSALDSCEGDLDLLRWKMERARSDKEPTHG